MTGERRLAAVLSADAVGHGHLTAEQQAAEVRTIHACRHEIASLVGQRRGRVVDAPGDNLVAEFPTATDAVECALDVQRALEQRNAPLSRERRLEFRVGVHFGEVHVEGGRIFGDGVDVASGIEALAEPGGILVSKAALEQAPGLTGLRLDDLGARGLENRANPVHLFRVRRGEPVRSEREYLVRMLLATVLLIAAGVWAVCPSMSGR